MQKKLYRSRTNKSFSGVCGGLGEFLNVDPTIVRVLWVIASLFMAGFPGLIVYIILACVIPEEPEQPETWQPPYQQPYAQQPPQGWQPQPPQGQPPQGAWQTPPPAPPVDYTQPAPTEPVDPPSE